MDARTAAAVTDNPGAGIDERSESALLDDLVESDATPPGPAEMPVEPANTVPATVPPRGARELVTGSVVVASGWDSVRLAVADDNRREIHIYATSGTATDSVLFGDDSSKLAANMSAAILYSGQEIILSDYCGPIWVKPAAGITGPITVSFVAVTR